MTSTLRSLALSLALVGLTATAADAASLTITADQASYQVGDVITLQIVGDSEGGTDVAVYGRLVWDGSLATAVSSSQNTLTSYSGAYVWTTGALPCSGDYCTAFNQIGSLTDFPVDNLLESTVQLQVTAPGTLDINWLDDGSSASLHFFGLTSAPGVSIPVPEPATGALVAAGLVALAAEARRLRRR